MYRSRAQTKTKKSLQELEQIKNTELNIDSEQKVTETIKPEDLLRYISMWDFSKVQSAIKQQISSDQSNYNNDISDALNKLNKSVDAFTNVQTELMIALWALNNLLSYVDWKDYFIEWFNNVTFDLSDSNNKALSLKIDELTKIFWKDETVKLLGQISNSITSSKSLSDTTEENDSPFWDKPKILETNKEENELKTFNIEENFSEEEGKNDELDSTVAEEKQNSETNTFDIGSSFAEIRDDTDNVENSTNNEIDKTQDDVLDNNNHVENEKQEEEKVSFNIEENFSEEESDSNSEIKEEEKNQDQIPESAHEEENNDSDEETDNEAITEENEVIENKDNEKEIEDKKESNSFDIADSFSDFSKTSEEEPEEESKMEINETSTEVNKVEADENSQKEDVQEEVPSSNTKRSYFDSFESMADYSFEDEEEDKNQPKVAESAQKEERLEEFKLIV